jgi:hypothetical protein
MLIDRYLPQYDVTEVQQLPVKASPDATYGAIRKADLHDPMIDALFAIRELPDRLARRFRGAPPRPTPGAVTFETLATPEMGWVLLGEEPGVEFVVGAVGRFWQRDYGWRPVAPERFAAFDDAGYAKIAVSFRVEELGADGALLRYEARTATTDADARKRFRRYWRIVHPGVALVMRHALLRIGAEAERRQAEPAGVA